MGGRQGVVQRGRLGGQPVGPAAQDGHGLAQRSDLLLQTPAGGARRSTEWSEAAGAAYAVPDP
jgi:hypothetical protein